MRTVSPIEPSNDTEDEGLSYRQPPHNLEAEQMLLGAILVNNIAAEKVQGFLRPEHFYEPVHGRIYDAVLRMMERDQAADPIKLKPYFEKDEALAESGGAAYLVRLAASAATIINAEDYGRTIYDLALRRELIQIGEEMVITAYDSAIDHPATDQIEQAEQELFDLSEKGAHEGGFQPFSLTVTQTIKNIEMAYKDPDNLSGVTMGLKDLNRMLGGLHKSDLVILAGRPSMGKTALATNIGFNAALQWAKDMEAGIPPEQSKGAVVGFFSLEMSSDQLAARILAERSKIPSESMRRGKLKEKEFQSIARAAREIEEVPFYIDDTPALSIAGLRTRARRLKRRRGLSLVIVDYLQLMRGTGRGHSGENRVMEISEITRGLKSLAKELEVPVLALSQLSRMVENRENKRPQLSDLRESGTIEQDADMVLFVFREEYYAALLQPPNATEDDNMAFAKMRAWQDKMDELRGVAQIIVGKHRHGPTGTVELHFEKEFTLFADAAKPSHLPEEIG